MVFQNFLKIHILDLTYFNFSSKNNFIFSNEKKDSKHFTLDYCTNITMTRNI